MDIGIELNFNKTDLDAIKNKCGDDSQCFTEMLSQWLKQAYPLPTQRTLIKALRSPAVNQDQLANSVEIQDLSNLDDDLTGSAVVPRPVLVPYIKAENVSFPQIVSEVQDKQSRIELEQRLKAESEDLRFKFLLVMHEYFNSLEDRQYPIQRLIRPLESCLETDCLVPQPKIINDIMKLIENKSSFFNYRLIKYMIQLNGTDNDKQNLEKYQTDFRSYAERRIYECPAVISKSNPNETELHVKLDSKYDKCTLSELEDLRDVQYCHR